MMQYLLLDENQIIRVTNVTLPLGKFVRFQSLYPDADFSQLANPKVILERELRKFTALTQNDEIVIQYNKKRYPLLVQQTLPEAAVCCVETDMEFEIFPPVSFQTPDEPLSNPIVPVKQEPSPSKIDPFSNSRGYRLDGKPFVSTPSPPIQLPKGAGMSSSPNVQSPVRSPFTQSPLAHSPDTNLTFGRGQQRLKKSESSSEDSDSDSEDEKKSKFIPFSGAGRTLK